MTYNDTKLEENRDSDEDTGTQPDDDDWDDLIFRLSRREIKEIATPFMMQKLYWVRHRII